MTTDTKREGDEMTTTNTTAIHPFEKAGLGKAPFRLAGMEHQEISHGERVIGSVGGCAVTTKPGGTCDYCGAYILNIFRVESSDGKRFRVGSDCVEKVRECGKVAGAEKVPDLLKKAKKDRDAARIQRAKDALPRAEVLKGQPHPTKFLADNGATLADYCGWLFRNGGTAGQMRAARMVEAALTPTAEE